MRAYLLYLLVLVSSPRLMAQLPLKLPALLSDHAVLQQNASVRLWGKGPGSFELKIVGSWQPEDTLRVMIGPECSWLTTIQTPANKGPHTITFICGKETQTIHDIVMGDVWLCAGQSNMEYSSPHSIEPNEELRFFTVDKNYDNLPLAECSGKWVKCDSATAAAFSTVGLYFGRQLNRVNKSPVGLIGAYWGGTNIQTWMPGELFKESGLAKTIEYIEPYGWAPKGVASLYNGMIYPLKNYQLKGCIWYQGEANVDWDWDRYADLLSAMVQSWRNEFGTAFPFFAVEIAPWNGYKPVRGAALREQVQLAAQRIPDFGSIGIADLVPDTNDIHPSRKSEVGIRLAELVLKKIYKVEALQVDPPQITAVSFQGNYAYATCTARGVLRSNAERIGGFQLAGTDGVFYPAKANLLKGNRIEIFAPGLLRPTALRYCFENASVPDLSDNTRLPVKQFRTDNYPIN